MKAGGYCKPLIAYIAGKGLTAGIRFSHASAVIAGGKGTAGNKIAAQRNAGARVGEKPEDLGPF